MNGLVLEDSSHKGTERDEEEEEETQKQGEGPVGRATTWYYLLHGTSSGGNSFHHFIGT